MVEARLAPAATLTIQVMTNDGPPNPDTTRVSVEWGMGKFPVELKPQELLWVAVGNTPAIRSQGLAIEFDQPSVTMGPMLAGVPIRVSASEVMSKTKESRELVIGAAESRVVTLPLRSVFHRLRGRVVTSGGAPVNGATVLFGIPDFQRTTDENGSFDFGAVAPKVVDLRVSTKTHAFWESTAVSSKENRSSHARGGRSALREGPRRPGPAGERRERLRRRPVRRHGARGRGLVPARSAALVSIRVFFDGINHEFQHHTAAPEVTFRLDPLDEEDVAGPRLQRPCVSASRGAASNTSGSSQVDIAGGPKPAVQDRLEQRLQHTRALVPARDNVAIMWDGDTSSRGRGHSARHHPAQDRRRASRAGLGDEPDGARA